MNSPPAAPASLRVPVLIVGAGPVGLALACELGSRSIACRVIERRDGRISHPKMNQVGVRTMEFCRRWGVAPEVRRQSIADDFPRNYLYVTGTNGHELARFEFPSRRDTPLTVSPEALQRCSQHRFDPILRDHAKQYASVALQYDTHCEGFEQDAEGVNVRLRDVAGRASSVRCDYLVACDGADSAIREALGIGLEGDDLDFNLNVFFRSRDTGVFFPRGRALMQWIFGPQGMWADVVAIDGVELWRLSIMRLAPGATLTHEQAAARIREAVGRDFNFEVISILPWTRRRVVAEHFSQGRVFLCGDAVHQMSPTGGFGMNTGIQEAVDLGWKLAATLKGWGGPKLLDSYDRERRPIAVRTTNEGARNYLQFLKLPFGEEIHEDSPRGESLRRRIGEAIHAEHFEREYAMMGVTLGYRYEGSPIVVPDGTPEPPDDAIEYRPSARPGHRAPHAWLADGRSTLDLFGAGFTLLSFDHADAGVAALAKAAQLRNVPFVHHVIDDARVRELYASPLVLVRPDGHVAWRGERVPDDALALIDTVRGA